MNISRLLSMAACVLTPRPDTETTYVCMAKPSNSPFQPNEPDGAAKEVPSVTWQDTSGPDSGPVWIVMHIELGEIMANCTNNRKAADAIEEAIIKGAWLK